MASSETQGGTHGQHVRAGQQSHKNMGSSASRNDTTTAKSGQGAEHSTRGGTHEQHVKAGQQTHKNS